MQTMRSFLQTIDARLVPLATDHHPGYVSDLLFNGFDTTIALVLPRLSDSDEPIFPPRAALWWQHHNNRSQALGPAPHHSRPAEGTIEEFDYAARLVACLVDNSPGTTWTALFWGGYADWSALQNTLGPGESFLRDDPYALLRVPSAELQYFLSPTMRLPSLLFDSEVSCILTQPIYGDRLYVSCGFQLASALSSSLPDVYPVSPSDPLPQIYD